jgi:predicted nicotinamide N-methyase
MLLLLLHLATDAPHAASEPPQAEPLLLAPAKTSWKRTHYALHQLHRPADGKPTTTIDAAAASSLPLLASCVASAGGHWPRDPEYTDATLSFAFGEDLNRPLLLEELPFGTVAELPDSNRGGPTTGHRVWDAAVVLALFLRSGRGRGLLAEIGEGARVLELGAGLGLPGLDLARAGLVQRVTLSDGNDRLVAQLRRAASRVHQKRGVPPTELRVQRLDWSVASELAAVQEQRAAEVCLGSDLCYKACDVEPLAAALDRMRSRLTLLAAPTTRVASDALAVRLGELGAAVREHTFTLVSSDADAAGGERGEAHELHAAPFRVLEVRWPGASHHHEEL